MSTVLVRVPTPLRSFAGGNAQVTSKGRTVRDVLHEIEIEHPGFLERVVDSSGEIRGFVNLYVGSTNIRSLNGLETEVDEGSVLSIIPAVAGGAPRARDRRLAQLKEEIQEITPQQAWEFMNGKGVLVDVREAEEVAAGSPPGSLRINRGFLELRIEQSVPDPETAIAVMCAGGVRSLLAADDLRRMGYQNVVSVVGGFNRWKNEGQPVEIPRTLGPGERERYGRHLLIPEVGEKGQLRLLDSKVLLVGAGGLGSPAALYLAAAGVGTLGVVDDDVVDRSNLQRQILHTDDRVGTAKVDSATQTLKALNPNVEVVSHRLRLNSHNVEKVFNGYDVIVDGSDNFPTRYLVNDACVKLGLPNVHGSIFRFEGQVSVFWPGRPEKPGPCYRCLFPEPPPAELAPSCAEAGVLGILPGVIGTLEAVETIKVLLELGQPLVGRLLLYDALNTSFSILEIDRDPSCAVCGEGIEFPGYVDYEEFCSAVDTN